MLVVSVTVPSGIQQPLVLLISQGEKVIYRVFDIDLKKFPFGSCKVVNFSKKRLHVLMDKDSQELKSGKQHLFAEVKEKQVRAWLRIVDSDDKKVIFSSMMMRRAQKRLIIFIIDDSAEGSGGVKTRVLVDFKPAPKKGG